MFLPPLPLLDRVNPRGCCCWRIHEGPVRNDLGDSLHLACVDTDSVPEAVMDVLAHGVYPFPVPRQSLTLSVCCQSPVSLCTRTFTYSIRIFGLVISYFNMCATRVSHNAWPHCQRKSLFFPPSFFALRYVT